MFINRREKPLVKTHSFVPFLFVFFRLFLASSLLFPPKKTSLFCLVLAFYCHLSVLKVLRSPGNRKKTMPQHASKAKKTGGTSIVDLVLQDHVTVKDLYKEIQSAGDQDAQKQYEKMCWEIALHAVAEELVRNFPFKKSFFSWRTRQVRIWVFPWFVVVCC